MEVGEQPCKSWFLINRSFKDTILANDAYIKKRKCRIGFDFTGELNIRMLTIKEIKKLGNLVSQFEK